MAAMLAVASQPAAASRHPRAEMREASTPTSVAPTAAAVNVTELWEMEESLRGGSEVDATRPHGRAKQMRSAGPGEWLPGQFQVVSSDCSAVANGEGRCWNPASRPMAC